MNIGYEFKDKNLLDVALTHISYANERNTESNQRLEFLGDSILSFVIAEYIYNEFKGFDEGKLTEMRAASVCEKTLAAAAQKLGLGDELKFGRSEVECGGKKASILCDTFEAVLGAIYLDGGIEPAKKWIMDNLKDSVKEVKLSDLRNYKSEIQNYFQKRDKGTDTVTYELTERSGPDHMPVFKVNAVYRNRIIGKGEGKNRKTAEQDAAKQALFKIEYGK